MECYYDRNRIVDLKSYISICFECENGVVEEDFYFLSCLNDLQLEKSYEEYTWLMAVLYEKEKQFYNNKNNILINDITDDDEIISKYISRYNDDQNYKNKVDQFIYKNKDNKNFIEEDIKYFYNKYLYNDLDLDNLSTSFKKKIRQNINKTDLEYTSEKIKDYLDDDTFDKSITDEIGYTLMTAACDCDEQSALEILQRDDIDLNQTDELGQTPFIVACQNSPSIAYQMIKQDNIELNKTNRDGNTPFMIACQYNPELAIEMSNLKNLNLDSKNCNGKTALQFAIENKPELALKLIEYNSIDNNKTGHRGETPFMTACKQGNKCAFEMLERDDVDFNAQDIGGNTAFIHACSSAADYTRPMHIRNCFHILKRYIDLIYEMECSNKINCDTVNNEGLSAYFYLKKLNLRYYYNKKVENEKLKDEFKNRENNKNNIL